MELNIAKGDLGDPPAQSSQEWQQPELHRVSIHIQIQTGGAHHPSPFVYLYSRPRAAEDKFAEEFTGQ